MMRKLKILGLAAVAVFAFAAVSSATASAAEFHTEKAPATVTAVQAENQVFVTESGTVTCKKVSGNATMSALSQSTLTTNKIEYTECSTKTIFGNISVEVNFTKNGCNYTFHANGEVDIGCTGSEGIIISGPGCTVTVPPQTGLKSVEYLNNTPSSGKVQIVPNVTNITSKGTGSLCSKTGTFTNGKYTGKVNTEGNNGAISVS